MPTHPFDRRGFLFGASALLGHAALGCSSASPSAARPSPTPRNPIVIVGAGITGLSIAHTLSKHRLDVLVLEATSRPGGRIRTLRTFRDGLYTEAGATHVVGDPDLLALCDELGVAIEPVKRARGLSRVLVARGERRVLAPGQDAPPEFTFSHEEEALGEEGREKRYFGLASRLDPRATSFPADIAPLDRLTAAAWLRSQGASPGFIQSSAGYVPGDGLEHVSALALLRELASIRSEIQAAKAGARGGRITGGSDRLPLALAQRLRERIAYDCEVRRIEQTPAGVELAVTGRHGLQRIAAERVVLTLPFSVVRRIEVAPGWSAPKARVIASFGMTSVTRVYLEVARRFWLERNEAGTADTDRPTGRVRDETELQRGTGGVLGAYLTGARARTFGAMDSRARVAAVLDDATRAHPGLEDHFVGGSAVVWDDEPFARGAYATFAPGQLAELPVGTAPEGRIHFAGDGLSHRPGFMHGALSSGRRVVAEILATR